MLIFTVVILIYQTNALHKILIKTVILQLGILKNPFQVQIQKGLLGWGKLILSCVYESVPRYYRGWSLSNIYFHVGFSPNNSLHFVHFQSIFISHLASLSSAWNFLPHVTKRLLPLGGMSPPCKSDLSLVSISVGSLPVFHRSHHPPYFVSVFSHFQLQDYTHSFKIETIVPFFIFLCLM